MHCQLASQSLFQSDYSHLKNIDFNKLTNRFTHFKLKLNAVLYPKLFVSGTPYYYFIASTLLILYAVVTI